MMTLKGHFKVTGASMD